MKIINIKTIKITFILLAIISTIFTSACTNRNSEQELNIINKIAKQNIEKQNEIKKTSNHPDMKEGQFIISLDNPVIIEHDNYYEIQNICLAKRVNYDYDYSLFENIKIGDKITLPNGEFKVENIEFVEDLNETYITLKNEFYYQAFLLRNNDKTAEAYYGPPNVELENIAVGNIYLSKDCIYNVFSYDSWEYTEFSISEFINKTDKLPEGLGIYATIDTLDEKNNISSFSQYFTP